MKILRQVCFGQGRVELALRRKGHGQVSIKTHVLFYVIRPCNGLDTIVPNGRKKPMFRLLLDTAVKTVAYRWQVIQIVETLVHRQIRFIPIKEGIEFDGQQDLRTKVMIAAGSYVVFQHQSGRYPDTYSAGWRRLRKQRAKKRQPDYRKFKFDILMANPPFAGDIKQSDMLSPYDLAHKKTGKLESAVGRDLLFIERNLDFLKPGGRMAIVLPQGRFNNLTDQRVREFIMDSCRILAVVGLHPNTFKPHTGTKTSVLFVQKWNNDPDAGALCPKVEDYNIFFATQQMESVNNSGEKVYVCKKDGSPLRDDQGHFIVAHDLFNHGGKTQDGIAEAFREFAAGEGLSFFRPVPSTVTA